MAAYVSIFRNIQTEPVTFENCILTSKHERAKLEALTKARRDMVKAICSNFFVQRKTSTINRLAAIDTYMSVYSAYRAWAVTINEDNEKADKVIAGAITVLPDYNWVSPVSGKLVETRKSIFELFYVLLSSAIIRFDSQFNFIQQYDSLDAAALKQVNTYLREAAGILLYLRSLNVSPANFRRENDFPYEMREDFLSVFEKVCIACANFYLTDVYDCAAADTAKAGGTPPSLTQPCLLSSVAVALFTEISGLMASGLTSRSLPDAYKGFLKTMLHFARVKQYFYHGRYYNDELSDFNNAKLAFVEMATELTLLQKVKLPGALDAWFSQRFDRLTRQIVVKAQVYAGKAGTLPLSALLLAQNALAPIPYTLPTPVWTRLILKDDKLNRLYKNDKDSDSK